MNGPGKGKMFRQAKRRSMRAKRQARRLNKKYEGLGKTIDALSSLNRIGITPTKQDMGAASKWQPDDIEARADYRLGFGKRTNKQNRENDSEYVKARTQQFKEQMFEDNGKQK
jgi:hypothetical protein